MTPTTAGNLSFALCSAKSAGSMAILTKSSKR